MDTDKLDPRLRRAGENTRDGGSPTPSQTAVPVAAPAAATPASISTSTCATQPQTIAPCAARQHSSATLTAATGMHAESPSASLLHEQQASSVSPSPGTPAQQQVVTASSNAATDSFYATAASRWNRGTVGLPHGAPGAGTPSTEPDAYSPSGDPKRARACEACRGLKVRCEPADLANPDAPGPCKRCAKARRQCIVTAPTRKRPKKADSRVAELEKKIDALTASLNANKAPGSTSGPCPTAAPSAADASRPPAHASYRPSGSVSSTSGSVPPVPAKKDQPLVVQPETSSSTRTPATKSPLFNSTVMVSSGIKRKLEQALPCATDNATTTTTTTTTTETPATAPPRPSAPEALADYSFSDVVDRRIITMATAEELWDRYINRMVPHLPAIVFPPGTGVVEVRKNKPALFLSIMASASSEMPTIQRALTKELMQMFAHKVIVVGEKYLELVQAMLVAVIWYYPPDHFEELKFYQLVHMASVMAIEIGLGRKRFPRGSRHIPSAHAWRDHPYRKHPFPDPCTMECRRTWLTCYFLAVNTSMALHRPNLIRWTPFMTECMEVLRTSPEAAPTDAYFCHLVWTHKIAEEVSVQFQLDDPTYPINVADNKTQHALRGFEYDLEKYSNKIPVELQQGKSSQLSVRIQQRMACHPC